MKKNLNIIGVVTLICFFVVFYVTATYFLDKRKIEKTIDTVNENVVENNSYEDEKSIISNLYKEARILYDVVNNKFKVDQDNYIMIGNIIYKRINNFDETMNNIFTKNGKEKYITDLGNYFAKSGEEYYLAGNLVSYQTYYFRGEESNIYVTDSLDNIINGIIYERWISGNKNTLATIKVVKENNSWLIDDITILANE